MIPQKAILSTAYFPNVQYVSKLLLHNKVIIDIHETFLKQSYRNRCEIYGANGRLNLTIPVVKPNGNRTKTKDIVIEYDTNWMQIHWRALFSAYKSSPFFEIFENEMAPLFQKKVKYLIDFNEKVLFQLFKSLGLKIEFEYSKDYFFDTNSAYDYRNSISPKKRLQKPDKHFNPSKYYQVFSDKHGFLPNLSFIDLMFNEGPRAIEIATKNSLS